MMFKNLLDFVKFFRMAVRKFSSNFQNKKQPRLYSMFQPRLRTSLVHQTLINLAICTTNNLARDQAKKKLISINY